MGKIECPSCSLSDWFVTWCLNWNWNPWGLGITVGREEEKFGHNACAISQQWWESRAVFCVPGTWNKWLMLSTPTPLHLPPRLFVHKRALSSVWGESLTKSPGFSFLELHRRPRRSVWFSVLGHHRPPSALGTRVLIVPLLMGAVAFLEKN